MTVSLNVRLRLLLAGLVALAGLAQPGGPPRATAQAAPPAVAYDTAAGLIIVGAAYSAANPAEAPYIGRPSHPDAPKAPISIPALAAALADLGHAELLLRQEGDSWLLRSDLEVRATARLVVGSDTIAALRLDSTPPAAPGPGPALTRLVANGGHLLIQGVSVTSWDARAGAVDSDPGDGRSYLLALFGGRMDIIDAEAAYLGWAAGEPSGVSWRQRATRDDPQSGATGSIIRSDLHHNYFGQYAYEAYGLKIMYSQIRDNLSYGIDPHDYSVGFEVAYNQVYGNGNHGIIFSRGCEQNLIHHNEVYSNAGHGIMLDRGSNTNSVANNLVYDNRDGIAIFQSSDNLIENNTLRDNERGVRINATYDANDIYDGVANGNRVVGNTIVDNSQYGVYLYRRADDNLIEGNTISGNALSGVYIKTGGNQIVGNVISANGHGVTIIAEPAEPFPPGGPTPVPGTRAPGAANVIAQNTIESNAGIGVQVRGGRDTLVGAADPEAAPEQGNLIRANGSFGVRLSEGTRDSVVSGNSIQANAGDGVQVRGAASLGNRISRNSIVANGGQAISLNEGGNGGLPAPTIASAPDAATITGTAAPGATVEIYRDQRGEARAYKGSTTADGAGNWSFGLPAGDDPAAEGWISALAIAADGSTSAVASQAPIQNDASYEVGAGRNGELTVFISGPGAAVTLPEIRAALQTISPTVELLEDQGDGVWQANASLFIGRDVRLEITAASGARWLKLRSQGGDIRLSAGGADAYNYQSFVQLRAYNGDILIDGVKISSWDPAANDYDRDISNGRSYLLAKYDARMDIRNAELSYLGSADGESYGVSWRDTNDSERPDELRARVTGEVIDSVFSHNYYGIYTYQASDMVFRGNQFHSNIGYGFDPHDFSNNFLVEDNDAFNNGNHGFIISRGCNNFTFRNNRSYNNRYTMDDRDRNAHGFMLDPGSPTSRYPQEPSFDNLLENNQAWGNDGYGLRVVGSVNNSIRGNQFRDNLQGVTLEQRSTGNLVEGNTISGSGLYGVYLIGGSDDNIIRGNTVSGSGLHGIYIKTGGNQVLANQLRGNGSALADGPRGAGVAFLPDTAATAASDLVPPGAAASLAGANPELLSQVELASALAGNTVGDNLIVGNLSHGIELKGTAETSISGNTISQNGGNGIYLSSHLGAGATATTISDNLLSDNWGRGIRANGAESSGNTWSQNSVAGNAGGGIWTTSGANGALRPPTISEQSATLIAGTTVPGATVEVYSDDGSQGRYFEGAAVADGAGNFRLSSPAGWRGPNLNAFATAPGSGSSGFSVDQGELRPVALLPLVRR